MHRDPADRYKTTPTSQCGWFDLTNMPFGFHKAPPGCCNVAASNIPNHTGCVTNTSAKEDEQIVSIRGNLLLLRHGGECVTCGGSSRSPWIGLNIPHITPVRVLPAQCRLSSQFTVTLVTNLSLQTTPEASANLFSPIPPTIEILPQGMQFLSLINM